mmetsp:Transcript_30331/g.43401  ORF Transcript_30331/g.43401 Transcript_30331/m.43401 type:complete len:273 (-) Transcript_30331:2384-3202(-)
MFANTILTSARRAVSLTARKALPMARASTSWRLLTSSTDSQGSSRGPHTLWQSQVTAARNWMCRSVWPWSQWRDLRARRYSSPNISRARAREATSRSCTRSCKPRGSVPGRSRRSRASPEGSIFCRPAFTRPQRPCQRVASSGPSSPPVRHRSRKTCICWAAASGRKDRHCSPTRSTAQDFSGPAPATCTARHTQSRDWSRSAVPKESTRVSGHPASPMSREGRALRARRSRARREGPRKVSRLRTHLRARNRSLSPGWTSRAPTLTLTLTR